MPVTSKAVLKGSENSLVGLTLRKNRTLSAALYSVSKDASYVQYEMPTGGVDSARVTGHGIPVQSRQNLRAKFSGMFCGRTHRELRDGMASRRCLGSTQ